MKAPNRKLCQTINEGQFKRDLGDSNTPTAAKTPTATNFNRDMITFRSGDVPYADAVREKNKSFVKTKPETHVRTTLEPISPS